MAASRVFDVEDAPAPPGQTSTRPIDRRCRPHPLAPEQDVGGSGENLLGQRRVGHDRNVTQAENGHRHDRSVPTDQSQHPALATRQVGNRVGGREGRAKSTGRRQARWAAQSIRRVLPANRKRCHAYDRSTAFRVGQRSRASKRPQHHRFPKVRSGATASKIADRASRLGMRPFHRRASRAAFRRRPYVGHARYRPPGTKVP